MRSTIALVILLATAACGVKKQLDDVHNNAGQLADTTARVENSAANLEERVETGMIMGTQGIGSMSRTEMLQTLITTRSIEEKFLYAAKYFYSFEFQLWQLGSNRSTSLALREQLKAEAITEFGRVLYRFSRQLRRGNATAQDNMSNSLYALASMVERSNPLQPTLLANSGVESANLLEIIQAGLLKADQLNKGHIARGDLSNTEREVLREEQVFTRFLQVRSKILPVLALGITSNIENGLWSQVRMLARGWSPGFTREGTTSNNGGLNIEQIGFAADKLEDRAREQRVLTVLNAAVPLDREIRMIWRNMNLNPIRVRLEADPHKNAAISASLDRFEMLVQDLLL